MKMKISSKIIYYRSDNGYVGIIIGQTPSIVIKDACGRTVFHALRSKIKTKEELHTFVDNYPYTIAELLNVVR